ncbi:MAG: Holliday junction resolvase RuvX [Bacteroidia bacterium]|nr:Holliday junction resolvase RuvX [Bacteroidia bacterium]
MSRILAIDYGTKRTGLAWTDPLQIIATGIGSFDTYKLKDKMHELCKSEDISEIVLGFPTRMDGSDTHSTQAVREFGKWITATFPNKTLHYRDERFTSQQAFQTMIDAGLKRKKRRDKHLVNTISATIILQDFLKERE